MGILNQFFLFVFILGDVTTRKEYSEFEYHSVLYFICYFKMKWSSGNFSPLLHGQVISNGDLLLVKATGDFFDVQHSAASSRVHYLWWQITGKSWKPPAPSHSSSSISPVLPLAFLILPSWECTKNGNLNKKTNISSSIQEKKGQFDTVKTPCALRCALKNSIR